MVEKVSNLMVTTQILNVSNNESGNGGVIWLIVGGNLTIGSIWFNCTIKFQGSI